MSVHSDQGSTPGEHSSNTDRFIYFKSLSSTLRDLIKGRGDILSRPKVSAEELCKNSADILYAMIRLRQNHRNIHQRIDAKTDGVTAMKNRLETVSNYYEGILYQKSNIEREILNCKNTPFNSLDKVEEIQGKISLLGKRERIDEIDALDVVSGDS